MFRQMTFAAVMVAGASVLTACTGMNTEPHIIHGTVPSGEISLVTDAKQRVITRKTRNASGTGEVLCAEPSPDVTQAFSDALKLAASFDLGKASGSTKTIGADFGRSTASAVAQLGERLAVIQLLRDKMYRACEAYANGAVGKTGYTIMLARLDKTMSTLLATEMAAGAFGRPLQHLGGGSASTGGIDPAKLEEARSDVQAKAASLKTAGEGEKAKEEREAEVKTASEALSESLTKLFALEWGSARTAATGAAGNAAVRAFSAATGESAASLVSIHQGYLNDSGIEPLMDACINAMSTSQVSLGALATYDQKQDEVIALQKSLDNLIDDNGDTKALNQTLKKKRGEVDTELQKMVAEFKGEDAAFARFCASSLLSMKSGSTLNSLVKGKALMFERQAEYLAVQKGDGESAVRLREERNRQYVMSNCLRQASSKSNNGTEFTTILNACVNAATTINFAAKSQGCKTCKNISDADVEAAKKEAAEAEEKAAKEKAVADATAMCSAMVAAETDPTKKEAVAKSCKGVIEALRGLKK